MCSQSRQLIMLYEPSMYHISNSVKPRSYAKSPLHRMCFGHNSSAVLEWLKDGDCYLMQSGGWPYSKGWQEPLKGTISLCSFPLFEADSANECHLNMYACIYMWVVQVKFKLYVTWLKFYKIEVYSDGKTLRLLKLVFFTYKGAGVLQTSLYITQ